MVDTAYLVKSILPGSFKHFVDIYFSKSVCISVCKGWGEGSGKGEKMHSKKFPVNGNLFFMKISFL